MELTGRVALVTGAARRVGRAIALALGERGMRVAVHCHASAADADEVVRELGARGTEGRVFVADLRAPDEPARLVAAVIAAFGGIDVLVNSAAVMRRTPLGEVTPADWDDILALNLRAPFLLSQAAAASLTQRSGAIINVTDLAAYETWPAYLPHGIAKAGLAQMTRGLARVLAPAVRVNGVAPGPVLLPEGWPADATQRLVDTTPLARLGSPADVTQAILYLLDAGYVTGETLIVDGGRHVRL